VDPYYLTWKAKINGFKLRLIELAGHINGQMPNFTVSRLIDALNERKKSLRPSCVLT
jgi:UDP-N-acetyl-D-glucosamine dehydrogenase